MSTIWLGTWVLAKGAQEPSWKGLCQGDLSFNVPGLENAVEGSWIAVDKENADEATRTEFERTHRSLASLREDYEVKLTDTLNRMVNVIDALERLSSL